MDINLIRGIATLLAFGGFLCVCWWVYGFRRRQHFDEAANLPFADDAQDTNTLAHDKGTENS